jgi:hypothetical protein
MHLHSLSTQHTNISQDINICRHRHSHPLVPHKPHIPILPLVQTPAAHSATRTLPRGPCRTRAISLSFSLSFSLSLSLSLSLDHTHAHTGSTLATEHTHRHTNAHRHSPVRPCPDFGALQCPPSRSITERVTACQHNTQTATRVRSSTKIEMQEKQGDARDAVVTHSNTKRSHTIRDHNLGPSGGTRKPRHRHELAATVRLGGSPQPRRDSPLLL